MIYPEITEDQREFFDWHLFHTADTDLAKARGVPLHGPRKMSRDPGTVGHMLRELFAETAAFDWSPYMDPGEGLEGAHPRLLADWLRDPDTQRDYVERWLFAFGPANLRYGDDVESRRAYAEEKGLTLAEAKKVLAQFPGSPAARRGRRRKGRSGNPASKLKV